ncbi:nucleotide-binding universal stress UspA family protein [Friedmanniella endophytica]|uniref:Nucleotide-binding universal stress UspA family protein n=1 Tax=Microlunatus kandeliicorticis TaxID=1759536 RepID=A0A7W3IPJ8_9ACTN|nr:nucleotide-binding universal stress UspA family protein [Microlunatus kandeliicorticis]
MAASIARRFGTTLVCVSVDTSLVDLGTRPDGSVMMEPIDPDTADTTPRGLSDGDETTVRAAASTYGVDVSFVPRIGDASRALSQVAEDRDAVMLVVGTRTAGGRIAEFFTGSVAARLAHQQHRPVLVVPVDPVGFDASLPWDTL